MRQSIYEINGVTVMEDCYNASPDSMRAAFDVIKRRNEKRKTAVLADMLELGEKSPEYHFKTGVEAAKVFDTVSGADVNIKMIDQGSSELNIIVGVDERDFEATLNAIYNEFVK